LHARCEEIEEALGGTLEWHENPAYKASRIALRHVGDWRDENFAPGLAHWLVSTAELFATAFPKYTSEVRRLS